MTEMHDGWGMGDGMGENILHYMYCTVLYLHRADWAGLK